MEPLFTLAQAVTALSGVLKNCQETAVVSSVSTDTRTLSEGALYIALRGENFDGHQFIDKAVEAGAICCVVEAAAGEFATAPVLVVEDTRKALRDLAAYYRSKFSIPVVGVTGSVGKTSTKEMLASVLQQGYQTHITKGNFNNEIGLPLTVFQLSHEDELMVLEMGMSDFGEISRLTQIARPDTAVITNIGLSHIEQLGSREGIKRAKFEILEGLSMDGTVILNGDDDLLWGAREELQFETLYYGIQNKNCDLLAYDIRTYSDGSEFTCRIDGEPCKFFINVPGEHHIYNALAAILAGIKYDVEIEQIQKGVRNFLPTGLRQTVIELPNYTVIRDCYNASPTSMKSGLEVLSLIQGAGRRVACLADMLELGEISAVEHKKVGKMAVDYGVDALIAVGKEAKQIALGAKEAGLNPEMIYHFESNGQLREQLQEILKKDDVILVKGSRGMRMEEIADAIAELS